MSEVIKRLQDVAHFFNNNDTVLGYRKLMDCVIDTQNLDLFKATIELTDWKEQHPERKDEFISRSLKLIE